MENIQTASSKEIVLEFFSILFNKESFDLPRMNELLADNFEQHYDGRVRGREQIYNHFKGHVQANQTSDIEFVAVLEHNEVVFAHYMITSYKVKGGTTQWQVLAKFIVENNQLVRFDQLSEIVGEDLDNA